MTTVRFYDRADDEKLRFAVIVTKSDGHWVFCKHKERSTLEVPGGHREPGEDILTTAKRELYEETGAVDFSIEPVCVYSVTMPGKNDGRETFGMLFFADVKAFEQELHSEIERIVIQDDLPAAWTYPEIQPHLMAEVQGRQRIRAFWKAVLAQKREDLPAYFAPDAVIRWHCSDEQFTPEEYIRANCDYPGKWDGIIERIDKTQAGYVTVVKVFPADHSASYHVVSFMALENDRIVSLDEYWADDGSAPEWRKKMKIGVPICGRKESQTGSPRNTVCLSRVKAIRDRMTGGNIRQRNGNMIALKWIDKDSEHKEELERINIEAIPECERNSLDDLMDTGAEVQGIFLDDSPVGYFVLREYKSILYLAYFAVCRERRSEGIGSRALQKLTEEKKDHLIVVEFEAPPGSEPDHMAERRRAFYLRNGFYETGWFTFYDETEFEIACTSTVFDIDAFNEFTEYLSTLVSDHIPHAYRKDG